MSILGRHVEGLLEEAARLLTEDDLRVMMRVGGILAEKAEKDILQSGGRKLKKAASSELERRDRGPVFTEKKR